MKATLLKPPSVNHVYGLTSRSGHATSYITKDGIAWFEAAAGQLKKAFKQKPISDPVEIWVDLYHIRKQDVDNVLKPLLDVLSKWCIDCQTKSSKKKSCACTNNRTVLVDDDQVYRLNIEKYQIKKGEKESVQINIMGY